MPLTGSGSTLSAAFVLAGGIVDPPGITKSGGMSAALVSWLVANMVVNNIPPNGTMTAAGSTVTGVGRISFAADGNDFGDALAQSIPAADAPGIAKWRAFATAIHEHVEEYGRVNPSGYTASPSGGAVTGTGVLSLSSTVIAPTLAAALGLVDAANQATWLALGSVILSHITSNALVQATGFSSPPGGGLLTGASVVT
jgi:hypothetical protein